jgi:transcriptional regulator with XRE-family HTH domain
VRPRDTSLSVSFGHVVRQSRLDLGFSQEILAGKAGVHRTYIGDVENGRKSPTLDVIASIATALGLAIHELIAQAEQRNRRTPTRKDRTNANQSEGQSERTNFGPATRRIPRKGTNARGPR